MISQLVHQNQPFDIWVTCKDQIMDGFKMFTRLVFTNCVETRLDDCERNAMELQWRNELTVILGNIFIKNFWKTENVSDAM